MPRELVSVIDIRLFENDAVVATVFDALLLLTGFEAVASESVSEVISVVVVSNKVVVGWAFCS